MKVRAGLGAGWTVVAMGVSLVAPSAAGAVSKALSVPARDAQVVATPRGDAVAVWRDQSGERVTLLASRRAAGRRSWTAPEAIVRVAARRTRLRLLRVVIDDGAAVRALWSAQSIARPEVVAFRSSTQSKRGAWRPATLVVRTRPTNVFRGADADLGLSAKGRATMVWCQRGAKTTDEPAVPEAAAGLWRIDAAPGGSLQRPKQIQSVGGCALPQLQVTRSGRAIASYIVPTDANEYGFERLSVTRTAEGVWDAGAQSGNEPDDERAMTSVLDEDGTLHGFFSVPQFFEEQTRYWSRPAGVSAGALHEFPRPSARSTLDGRLGGGSVNGTTGALIAGAPMVLEARGSDTPRGGGASAGALWSRSKSRGRWVTQAVDDLAETGTPANDLDGWPQPALAAGRSGSAIATWTSIASVSPCLVTTYRSTRSAAGRWSRRTLLAASADPARSADACHTRRIPPTVIDAAGIEWTLAERKLTVRSALPIPGAPAPAPSLRLRTTSWKAIRAAGAIEFGCRAARPGLCLVSLVRAEQSRTVVAALDGFCRASYSGVALKHAKVERVVRFPLASGCYDGGPAPHPATASLRVPVVVAFDAIGRRSARRVVTFTIRP